MRHRKSGVKLNRTTSHRQAMFRNMVTSLFKYERIQTTDAKAKELRRWADHIVTLAKRGDLHARRMAMSIVREKDVVHKLFEEAQERFGAISGGYTRIIKIGRRPGDAAAMTLVELVRSDDGKPATKKKTKTKAVAPPVAASPAQNKESAVAGDSSPTETAAEKTSEASPDEKEAAAQDDSEDTAEVASEESEIADAEKGGSADVQEEVAKDPNPDAPEK